MVTLTDILVIDSERVYKYVLEALNSGVAYIRDGVVYSNEGKIMQHLPLKSISWDIPKEIENLTQATKVLEQVMNISSNVQLATIATSTTLIMGAIVTQTIYLSQKLDKLQNIMELVSDDIQTQNILFYTDKISTYFGTVESARILLIGSNNDRVLLDETKDIASVLMNDLANKRNEIFSFIDNLIGIANNQKGKSLENMINFITMMLDMLPKAIYLESQLYDRYSKFKFSNHLIKQSGERWKQILLSYKEWYDGKVDETISGISNHAFEILSEKQEQHKLLFESKENIQLLQVQRIPNVLESK